MKDRIRKLLLNEGLTSGAFADEIGVQRSSISHILNGRNNPSLDFVVKTKNRFPKLNLTWLIMGIGDMYNPDNQLESSIIEPKVNSPSLFQAFTEPERKASPVNSEELIENEVIETQKSTKQVAQVLIFYSDMTFDAYKPGR